MYVRKKLKKQQSRLSKKCFNKDDTHFLRSDNNKNNIRVSMKKNETILKNTILKKSLRLIEKLKNESLNLAN